MIHLPVVLDIVRVQDYSMVAGSTKEAIGAIVLILSFAILLIAIWKRAEIKGEWSL